MKFLITFLAAFILFFSQTAVACTPAIGPDGKPLPRPEPALVFEGTVISIKDNLVGIKVDKPVKGDVKNGDIFSVQQGSHSCSHIFSEGERVTYSGEDPANQNTAQTLSNFSENW